MSSRESEAAVVIDFETTAKEWWDARVIEVGTWKFLLDDEWTVTRPHHTIKQFVSLERGMTVPVDVTRITGITDNHLRGAVDEKFAIEDLISSMFGDGTTIAIAHNAYYDASVLWSACERHGIEPPPVKFYDTLELFRIAFGEARNHKLEKLVEHCDVSIPRSHRAQDDCRATYLIMQEAMSRIGARASDLTEILTSIPGDPHTFRDVKFIQGAQNTFWMPNGARS